MATTDVLAVAYRQVTGVAESLDDADLMLRPGAWAGPSPMCCTTNCWTPAGRCARSPVRRTIRPDVDDVSYWRGFSPDQDAADSAAHARHVRLVAAAYPGDGLVWEWRETSEAAIRAARTCPYEAVTTQGHVLRTADFSATLAVEAAVAFRCLVKRFRYG